jgi:hypothetical protein
MEGRGDGRTGGLIVTVWGARAEGYRAVPGRDVIQRTAIRRPAHQWEGQLNRPMDPIGCARAGGSLWRCASLPSSPRCSRMRTRAFDLDFFGGAALNTRGESSEMECCRHV